MCSARSPKKFDPALNADRVKPLPFSSQQAINTSSKTRLPNINKQPTRVQHVSANWVKHSLNMCRPRSASTQHVFKACFHGLLASVLGKWNGDTSGTYPARPPRVPRAITSRALRRLTTAPSSAESNKQRQAPSRACAYTPTRDKANRCSPTHSEQQATESSFTCRRVHTSTRQGQPPQPPSLTTTCHGKFLHVPARQR